MICREREGGEGKSRTHQADRRHARNAVDYAMANQPQIVEVAMQKLGQQKKSIELACRTWSSSGSSTTVHGAGHRLYRLMFENKQIRQVPDLNRTSPSSSCRRTEDRLERTGHGPSEATQQSTPEAPSAARRRRQLFEKLRTVVLGIGFRSADLALGPRRRRDRHAARSDRTTSR